MAKQRKDAAQGNPQASTGSCQKEPLAGSQEAVASPAATGPLRLSRAYFRSVAEVMADAAEAVEHVHGAGILHRDLKPSNIMVGTKGECWIIDFGLATYPDDADKPEPIAESSDPELLTVPGAIAGTPEYLAPERLEGKADVRSDVWGLGATLYELLTLHQAFKAPSFEELCASIRDHEPMPPRAQVADVPRDLEAICRKALRKEPGQRYPTAGTFAEDLRRWLRHEPTAARPARVPRRVWLWAVRNPGWAIALVVTLLAVLGLGAGGIVWQMVERRAAEQRERAQHREVLLQRVQLTLASSRRDGWRETAWKWIREAAAIEAKDENLRLVKQATATLTGLDARKVGRFESEKKFEDDAAWVAFSPDGKRLLLGGANDRDGQPYVQARLVGENGTDVPRPSGQKGAGPVAFLEDGTPLQIVPRDQPPSLLVWNVEKRQKISECTFAEQSKVARFARNTLKIAVQAISTDGTLVAAAGITFEGKGVVAVWETASGKRVMQVESEAEANALALSPDHKSLAVVDGGGRVTVESILDRKARATFTASRLKVHCLTFSANGQRLATGDAGGTVTIWDWRQQQVLTICRGSFYDIYAVAFSPDGALLASTGRHVSKLWDAARGRDLLDLDASNYTTALAFSRDGRQLASGGLTFWVPGRVHMWELDNGRGIRTFRGLSSQVAQVQLSQDGTLLAALAMDWQVGIWNVKSGQLLRVLDAPPGESADNAALAFSMDNRHFAFSVSEQAVLWDLKTGAVEKRWDVPPGLADRMVFHPKGKLLLMRAERVVPAKGNKDETWVCRLRDLKAPDALKNPIKEIGEFSPRVIQILASPDGSHFIVDALSDDPQKAQRSIQVFDGLTGEKRWEVSVDRNDQGGALSPTDPTGKLVLMALTEGQTNVLVDVTTGRILAELPHGASLGPGAEVLAVHEQTFHSIANRHENEGIVLKRRKTGQALVVLAADALSLNIRSQTFNHDGSLLIWGNGDGTVTVCDLNEVQRRLTEVGLGW
ncbi:MAG: protein kinase [Planctomycetes bacterium]|nr:protein kinase [Planctomycetota bacterium]